MGAGNRRGWLAAAVLLGGCSANTYVCVSDDACPGGACEPDGFCSFPAPDCPTGRRYGEFSGPHAGNCVDQDGAGGTGSAEASTTGSSPTGASGTASGETTTSQTTTANPTSAGTCGNDTCHPAPPPGWAGPVKLVGNMSGCDRLGGSALFEAAPSFSGDWTCDCECDLFIDGPCTGAVQLRFFDDEACSGAPTDVVLLQDGCESTGLRGGSVQAISIPDATCSASPIQETSPIEAVDAQVLCDVPLTDTCPDGLCLPSDAAPTCIFRDGEMECPDEVYTARSVLYQSGVDGRACTECSCSAEGGCGGAVEFASACNGPDGTLVTVGECTSTEGLGSEASVQSLQADGSLMCVDEGGEPDGGVSASSPITACCAR